MFALYSSILASRGCHRFHTSQGARGPWQLVTRPVYRKFGNGQRTLPWYQNRNYLVTGGALTGVGTIYYVTHLEQVPISGRRRFMDLSPAQEELLAKQTYQEIMEQYAGAVLPQNHNYTKLVRKVAERIVRVAGMKDLKWEFYVIDSPEKNAFVLPGGKVFVFTGMMSVVQNEAGLAVILGHEIDVLFDTSRTFNQLITNLGVLLPFSRKMENEADEIGLLLSAQACYDPSEAIKVWKRMSEADEGQPPQFLSTHPSHASRIHRIEQLLPMAQQKRAASDCHEEANYLTQMFSRERSRW